MVTLHALWPIPYTGVLGGPIGRPRIAERLVILHTLHDRDHASFNGTSCGVH